MIKKSRYYKRTPRRTRSFCGDTAFAASDCVITRSLAGFWSDFRCIQVFVGPFSHKAVCPINPGMVLVTKYRRHDLCGRQRTGIALFDTPALHRPARIHLFLARLSGPPLPGPRPAARETARSSWRQDFGRRGSALKSA
jgi:hypothetical protein